MARDVIIQGETLVKVKGRSDSLIASSTELGLAADQIRISPNFLHQEVNANAWGRAPFEMQFMNATVGVSMTLVHFDRAVLDEILRLSMAGAPAIGQLPHAGARMGGGVARFAPGNNFMGLNLTSPILNKPWRFFYAVLTGPPMEMPLGVERMLVGLNWVVIPYTQDPYNGGLGALGQALWDYNLDS